MLGWIVVALLVLGGLFFLLGGDSAGLGDPNDTFYLVIAAGMLGVYAMWIASAYRDRIGPALLYLLIWLGIALALVGAYAYRDEITSVANRVAGELMPPGQVVTTEADRPGHSAVRIRGRGDGHFVARAEVNGASMTLLVDTGASAVVLKPRDAERAGIDTDGLSFTIAVSTANGTAYAAPVRIRSIAIGPIVVRDVEALVAKPGSLNESLLGMSFLTRLRSYEFSGDFLTLRS